MTAFYPSCRPADAGEFHAAVLVHRDGDDGKAVNYVDRSTSYRTERGAIEKATRLIDALMVGMLHNLRRAGYQR
jgi:hypothetical protein